MFRTGRGGVVGLHTACDKLPFTFLPRSKTCFLDNINSYLIILTVTANNCLDPGGILENSMRLKKTAKNEDNFSYLLTWEVSNLPKAELALLALQFMVSASKTRQVLLYWWARCPLRPLEQLLMIREMLAEENFAAFSLGTVSADKLCSQWWLASYCQGL